MNINFSVVGMYFGVMVDVDGENPSVTDVLQAVKSQTASSNVARFDYTVTTSTSGEPDEFFIANVTVTHLAQPRSRKVREDGSFNTYNSGIYSFSDQLSEAETREKIKRGIPVLAWQYYVFDPAEDGGGPLGDTISDDGIIIPANKSSTRYQLKEGSSVVLRLIALFGGPTGESFRKELANGFATSKQMMQMLSD